MVDLAELLSDIADTLRSCPEVTQELDGNVSAIVAYMDLATVINQLARHVYQMPSGSVLIAWMDTDITEGQMEAWTHTVDIFARAVRTKSPLKLLNAIIDGIPTGTDLRWRYQCVNDNVLPVEILEMRRIEDEENIDYYVIRCAFKEKSDS